MDNAFKYDVFLSHSSKDKAVVRTIAERLRKDKLRIWLDEWEIHPGDSIPAKIEEGLELSRLLILCMSMHAFSSDWATLESQTFRFRDPLNKDRRFIPLRLDNSPIKGSLAQFLYIDWRTKNDSEAYEKLIAACALPPDARASLNSNMLIKTESHVRFGAYAYHEDKQLALSGCDDDTMRLLDVGNGECLSIFIGHTETVNSVSWSPDGRSALSGSSDDTIRLWDIEKGECLNVFVGHTGPVNSVSWSPNGDLVLSGSHDNTMRLWEAWDLESRYCVCVFSGHRDWVLHVAWSPNGERLLSSSADKTIRLWDLKTGECLNVFDGHSDAIYSVKWSPNGRYALSGSHDKTIRHWDLETMRCIRIFEGHTGQVWEVSWSPDGQYALSGSSDNTIRLWNVETGDCLHIFSEHEVRVNSVAWDTNQQHFFSGDLNGSIRVWDIKEFVNKESMRHNAIPTDYPTPKQVQYTNAKVLLVGDSGAGKTGLSKRLALDDWQPTDSTVGAWATQWKLSVSSDEKSSDLEREIWLWDFGGQADQRLIHQLYMDETALAILVFDGQKEDIFETLGQWDRDLSRALDDKFAKLLVAGRVDAGGLRVSRTQLETFKSQRGYSQLLETSAKINQGCEELKQAILNSIQWENIVWRSSPSLFKQLKEEIVLLKDRGRVLTRFNELREVLQLSLFRINFNDEELKAVIGLLKGPGVVWELKFGSWILLQPERINSYAQAVIQTLRTDKYERGCLSEEQVLKGDLIYNSSIPRLKDKEEERIVLLAMHQILIERGLCLREYTDKGPLLIFPSYYRRERPELVGHPAVLVSYRFNGFIDEIYATLVVRLHHTNSFEQDELWRYAADFKTLTGRQLGIKLTRLAEGAGELEVYFDSIIPLEEKIIFSKYVHEHLIQNAKDVVRLRHYVCPYCGTPVGNRKVAMKKLEEGKKDIPCINCDDPIKRIPLWDQLEELFASRDINQQVFKLQKESAITLDNESKERALVGDVISTVALAGQLSREFNVSDHGIDMEIEFKSDSGEATGKKLYLQLKSGDSYLRERKRDEVEVFTIKDERHVRYWMAQAFPVLLIIRNSKGDVRWMEVREWLKRASENGTKPIKEIIFEGERFDVMSIRRWRDKILN